MMYLFSGSDVERVRRKAFEFVEAAKKKQSNVAYVRLAREDISEASLEEAASAGGLFLSRLLILIDDPFPRLRQTEDDEEATPGGNSVLEERFPALAASDNVIVILAPLLPAPKVKKLAALAAKSYAFERGFKDEMRGFNSGLVNALGAKNGDRLWLELVRAAMLGDAPEQLHGLLHWKARDLLSKGGSVWKREEARALSMALIGLLQESRRKGLDLAQSLEHFALSL